MLLPAQKLNFHCNEVKIEHDMVKDLTLNTEYWNVYNNEMGEELGNSGMLIR